jgi:hypothetical protein
MLTVQCPHCGSFNDESAATCYMCKKELPASAGRPAAVQEPVSARPAAALEGRAAAFRRPGCVSVYAILTFLSGIFGVVMALFLPTFLASNSSILLDPSNYPSGANPLDPEFLTFMQTYVMAYSIIVFLFSIVTFLLGWGLWTMRNWARILILISQGLLSIVSTNGNLLVCGVNSLSLVFPGIVFVWFLLNRKLFR